MWVRGLKLLVIILTLLPTKVAPYVGAWIETSYVAGYVNSRSVAPYVGAWIETNLETFYNYQGNVAPYVGAWIETE